MCLGTRLVLLAGLGLLIAGCPSPPVPDPGHVATAPTQQPGGKRTTKASPSTIAASPTASPTTRPSPARPSLTPRLERLVRALQAHTPGQPFQLRHEMARHIEGFASGDGKHVPEEASVEVLEVRKDFLLMAFVRVTPKGYRPCQGEADRSREVYALFIRKKDDGTQSLAFARDDFDVSETRLFQSKWAQVVFPGDAAPVPVFEVHYQHEATCGEMEGSSWRR